MSIDKKTKCSKTSHVSRVRFHVYNSDVATAAVTIVDFETVSRGGGGGVGPH